MEEGDGEQAERQPGQTEEGTLHVFVSCGDLSRREAGVEAGL